MIKAFFGKKYAFLFGFCLLKDLCQKGASADVHFDNNDDFPFHKIYAK